MTLESVKSIGLGLVRFSIIMLSKIDKSLPSSISIDMNKILGRGGGAEDISTEVSTALTLLIDDPNRKFLVFDIGANIGNYTSELLKNSKIELIYSFEPSMKTFNSLQNRYQGNTRVNVIHSAVGRQISVSPLYSDSELSGLASMSKRRVEHFGLDFKQSELVEVISLTEFCKKIGQFPDFIKIDVEGHELDVLYGANEILPEIKLVQFEFGGANIDSRTYFQDFWYFFKDHNFELFRMTPLGLKVIDSYSEEDEYFKTSNYLARNRLFSP